MGGETAVRITWEPALLFGHGHPAGGSGGDAHPVAEYEVYYMEDDDVAEHNFNLSTPCGLYMAHQRKRAIRKFVKTDREIVITGLKDFPVSYAFNVVARSVRTGH